MLEKNGEQKETSCVKERWQNGITSLPLLSTLDKISRFQMKSSCQSTDYKSQQRI